MSAFAVFYAINALIMIIYVKNFLFKNSLNWRFIITRTMMAFFTSFSFNRLYFLFLFFFHIFSAFIYIFLCLLSLVSCYFMKNDYQSSVQKNKTCKNVLNYCILRKSMVLWIKNQAYKREQFRSMFYSKNFKVTFEFFLRFSNC